MYYITSWTCILTVFTVISGLDLPDKGKCYECICRGAVNCLIEDPFWVDAGKPGSNFNLCMSNHECALQTMENYYEKFGRDCNNDGVIDCQDYARIHVFGPYGCSRLPNRHYNQIAACLSS